MTDVLEVPVDIQPRTCPNSIDPDEDENLVVAVLGSREFEVRNIDRKTIRLRREGVKHGISATDSSLEDVGLPFAGEPCSCRDQDGDGITDLVLVFKSARVIKKLKLDREPERTVTLSITGKLNKKHGRKPFRGQDCIRILEHGDPGEIPFAVTAVTGLVLHKGVRILGGNVGVSGLRTGSGLRGEPSAVILGARVDGDVYGDSVLLDDGAKVRNVYTNRLTEGRARYRNIYPFSDVFSEPPQYPRSKPEQEHFIVPERTRMILQGNPTRVEVGRGATLVLRGGEYEIEELHMQAHSRLVVEAPSRVLISGRLTTDSRTYLGPVRGSRAMNLQIIVSGADADGIPRVILGPRSQVNAWISAPSGTLLLQEKVKAKGAFLGNRVEIKRDSTLDYFEGLSAEYDPCGTSYCSYVKIEGIGFELRCITSAPFPQGTLCEDGNACTGPDTCDGVGNCVPGNPVADPDPNNDNPCKRDECDPLLGVDEPAGTICDPFVQCREPTTCDDSGQCSAFGNEFPFGTVCDDGIPNNGLDTCYLNGYCTGEFGPYNCLANNCGTPPNLECWLAEHPQVKNAVRWLVPPNSAALEYDNWETWRKQDLQQAFEDSWNWHQNGMVNFQGTFIPEPPTNFEPLSDNDPPITVLDESEAWPLYLAHVAHILMVEIKGVVPWSLCDYYSNPVELSELLQGTYYFWFPTSISYPGYAIRGNVTTAHPNVTFAFMVNNGLIGTTRLQTIANILNWARGMHHFLGPFTTKNMEYHWQYRGQPPVSRILDGTVLDPQGVPGYPDPLHWTKGCGGTSGFIKEVLRSVNIPVTVVTINQACPHATPYFPSEGRYLSHGDDPYTSYWKTDAPNTLDPPMEDFLLDQSTFTSWFGGSEQTACNNIGRGPYRVMIDYPPDPLVQQYCNDENQQLSHAAGSVYNQNNFYLWYTVPELEAAGFWTNLAQRAAVLGYCGN